MRTLARNDHTVRSFNQPRWRRSRGCCKGERGDLAASLHNLGIAMQPGLGLRPRQPRDPRQEHPRARRRHPDPGQAARGARRDAARRPAGPEQPGPDLQPAGRHPRHPRQPRRARAPDHLRPRDVPVRHPRPGQPGRPGLQRDPAAAGQEPAGRARRRRGPAYVDRPARTRPSADSWRRADDPRRLPGRPSWPSPCSRPRWCWAGAPSTSTSCRCPVAPTSGATRSRSPRSSATCSTSCPTRRSRSTT